MKAKTARSPGEDRAPRGERLRMVLALAILIVVPLLVFAPTLEGAYHLDDFARIVDNPELDRAFPPWRHFLDPRTSSVIPMIVQYRPMMPLTLSLDRAAADALRLDRRVVLHAANIGIHVATAVVVYFAWLELLVAWGAAPSGASSARAVALLSSLVFAVHPVSAVPVNYLCARDQLLMALFFFLFVLAHLKLRRTGDSPWRVLWAAPLLALSILSKTDAAAGPLVVLFIELTVARGTLLDWRTWARTLPSAAVVVGFFAYTKLVLRFSDADQLFVERGSVLEYPLSQLEVHVTYYLRNFAWPYHMRPLPDLEPVTSVLNPWSLVGLAVVIASVVVAWRVRARLPVVALAIGAYWALLAPTSSILPLRLLATDYRPYPALPWACLLVVVAGRALLPRAARVPAAVAVLAWLVAGSLHVGRVWRTEESLWGHAVRRGGATMAHHNYAMAVQARDPALAERHFEEALRLAPDNVRSEISLGLLLMRQGRTDEGMAHVARAVEMAPEWALTHHWHSRALSMAGRLEDAARESAVAARLEPRDPQFSYQAASDAQAVRDYDACLEFIAQLHAVTESHRDSRFIEGWCLQAKGRLEESVPVYRRFLADVPDHVQARFNLGHALKTLGRCEEAVPELQRALELRPSYDAAHLHLARCLEALGRHDEAAAHADAWERRDGGSGGATPGKP